MAFVNEKLLLFPGRLVPVLVAGIAGCATQRPFTADNMYDEPRPRAPVGAEAAEVFTRTPWELRNTSDGKARYQREAGLMLPDSAEAFSMGEVLVYATDGSDVQLVYRSSPLAESPESRAMVRISIHRPAADLDTEWKTFERKWHEKQAGTLVSPLGLPDNYPADAKRMAWTLPVGDGYGAPAFEQIVLFHSGGWDVRYKIAFPVGTLPEASKVISGFLRWIRRSAD
jgi:hypothetical protein